MNGNERPLFNSAATGDDGSLAALNIAPDENNKHFNCSETTIGRSFPRTAAA